MGKTRIQSTNFKDVSVKNWPEIWVSINFLDNCIVFKLISTFIFHFVSVHNEICIGKRAEKVRKSNGLPEVWEYELGDRQKCTAIKILFKEALLGVRRVFLIGFAQALYSIYRHIWKGKILRINKILNPRLLNQMKKNSFKK